MGISTASFGRFDAVQHGEPERQIESKRRKFHNHMETTSDLDRNSRVLERVLSGGSKKAQLAAASAAAAASEVPVGSCPGGVGSKVKSKGKKQAKSKKRR